MALSIAVHDLAARQRPAAVRQWGLDPDAVPQRPTRSASLTRAHAERVGKAADSGFGHPKASSGLQRPGQSGRGPGRGPRFRTTCRRHAASTAQEAIDNADWLADAGVTMLEQPVEAHDLDGFRRVTDATEVPVAADESCVTASDVPRVADAVISSTPNS